MTGGGRPPRGAFQMSRSHSVRKIHHPECTVFAAIDESFSAPKTLLRLGF